MELLAGGALLLSGYCLNNNKIQKGGLDANNESDKPINTNIRSQLTNTIYDLKSNIGNIGGDIGKISNTFKLSFFKKSEITNPDFDEKILYKSLSKEVIDNIKNSVNIDNKPKNSNLNDVGFLGSNNFNSSYDSYASLPSIDDIERDIDMTHNNMVPYFGSTIKENVNDNAASEMRLELATGNYKNIRRDNKQEVEYLFDPQPNEALVYGSTTVTNRDKSRFIPSATGKKHNEIPFEQIQVGPGVANGYTSRPSGGFHQDVRILPKTTEERLVNPKITYEARINAGKAVTEKGKLIGKQILKKPKSILWNLNGERNFTEVGVHKKNRHRADIILKSTTKDKLHCEYSGIAAPTRKSKNTPESLRGKKKISNKNNFANTPFRNLMQTVGKKMNDFGKTGYENKSTERSMISTRTHNTNLKGNTRGQQYLSDELRYTRKQDTIHNGRNPQCDGYINSKGGAYNNTQGPVYDPTEIAKTTIRETTEQMNHNGFMKNSEYKGQVYNENEIARTTIRETTEDNKNMGNLSSYRKSGKIYNQNETAKTTIRETTENNNHMGNSKPLQYKGKAYDQDDLAKVTIKETTENNNHCGWLDSYDKKGKVYDKNEIAKTTIKETTENNNNMGNIGIHKRKGKVYNQNETAKTTIRETTENNNYLYGVDRTSAQMGGGYSTTTWEAKAPQKAYICDNEYIGGGEATTNKKIRNYESEYRVNTNKEKIAIGRAPTTVKNNINAGKEVVNLCINKLESDREIPHVFCKGTNVGNIRTSNETIQCGITTVKNSTPKQVDRLQIETLDSIKNNPLMINQNFN